MIIGYTDLPWDIFTNIAIENGPVEITSLPIKSMLIFHSYELPEGTSPFHTFSHNIWKMPPRYGTNFSRLHEVQALAL